MIKNFEEYNKLNEESNWASSWALTLFMLFNMIGSDTPRSISKEDFGKYIKKSQVNLNRHNINNAIDDVKKKVQSDSKITNKQEIFNIIDSTLYLYDKKDVISKKLYKLASKPGGKTSCFVIFLQDGEGNDTKRPLIMLEKDAPLISIRHELYHIVNRYMKQDIEDITKMFDFKIPYKEYNKRYNTLTGYEYTISPLKKEYFDYMDASEIYSRLNNLKHFLYEYNYIKSPNDTIPEDVFLRLFTGDVYKSLSKKDRLKFRKSDFMDILLFLDLRKMKMMDQYVMNTTQNKNNKA